MKKGIIIIVVLVLSYAILAVGNGMLGGTEEVVAGSETLTGTAEGFGGEVSVIVTTEGGKIVKVEVTGADETPGIGTLAIDELPEKIVEANSADVDVVASATYTSEAIIKAVKNALASSSGSGKSTTLTGTAEGFGGTVTVTLTMNGDKIVNVEVEGADETPGIGTMAMDELPAKIVEANSADVEVVASATYTSEAIIKAVKNALENAGSGAGSTLTGTAEGFGGTVTVTLTMDGDKITNVDVVGADETPGIGTMAIDELPAKIVEANSAEVEVVAGATYTSEAIIEAVNSALGK